jgi:hypothetical protein
MMARSRTDSGSTHGRNRLEAKLRQALEVLAGALVQSVVDVLRSRAILDHSSNSTGYTRASPPESAS